MPMLERTAASLEPCNFQRVLPPTTLSLKSHRRLHTAFWHHGAVDIELSSVWQALVREPLESLNFLPLSRSSRSEPLSASAFLLDFLNPQSATSLLRRLSPSALDKYERPRLYLRGAVPRLFTSSAASAQHSQQSPAGKASEASAVEHEFMNDEVASEEEGFDEDYDDEYDEAESPAFSAQSAHVAPTRLSKSRWEVLHGIFQTEDDSQFLHAWRLYHNTQNIDRRRAIRNEFIDYAKKCRSMDQLLALAIKFSKWETFGDIWEQYPDAHRANARKLNWDHIESVLSVEEIGNGIKSLVFRIDQASKSVVREDLGFTKSLLDRVIFPCIRKYWRGWNADDLALMLHLLKDHLLYEDLICHSKELGPSLTTKLYRQYRKLPEVKLRGHVMREMMNKVFFPADDAAGMEMMARDWHRRFPRLDIPGFRLYMSFYARRGDVNAVQRLWDEYTTEYPTRGSPVGSRNPEYLPLLHVQAVRGELGEVRRVFDTLQNTYGTDLPVICWNVLLNAHGKAGEYDTAVRVFSVLQEACKPDKYSYGTIMGLSGSRGDLEFTLELYRMAKNDGIEPNPAMVDCVVEAYSQNDRHNDAESICVMTTKAHRFKLEECTVLWNTLLYHQASRRDLTAVNRLLVAMTEHQVPYNNETYDHLLRGLALCRQPHHALYLLTSAVKNHSFKPTIRHYALLMSAFLRSGQYTEALRSSTILRNLGVPKSNETMVRVFKALGAEAKRSPGEDDSRQRSILTSALRQFRKAMEPARKSKQAPQLGRAWIQPLKFPDTVASRTDLASVLIFVFTQMRQTMAVPEILQLWRNSSPEAANMQEPPLKLLEALMLSAFYDENYTEVKELWRVILDRAVHMSRVAAPGTTREDPLPSMRYILNNPLKTMQRMYAAQGDVDGLREVISSVLSSKFRLDSKNWNYYVQFLASMKKFREAFVVCEEQLMPHWLGWQRVRSKLAGSKTQLPLDLRRKGVNSRVNRPISHTLLTLTKAYMDLEQMAAWSPEADRLLSYIVDKCPGVMAAVKTLVRTGEETERRFFMSEKQAQLEEDMRREQEERARLGDKADEEVPQAFLDMMELAGAGQGTSVKQESWGDDRDRAVSDAQSDDGDSQWSDADESASEDWTPRGPGRGDKRSQQPHDTSSGPQASRPSDGDVSPDELRRAEDAVFATKKPAIFSSAAKSTQRSASRTSDKKDR
ncbi:hypothetical protein J7T55_014328 [Diaporthe amygdali]|uniref:uncharacterized protein n=1 Tax=Phomopsis amygdali TaxID=1214568 RepID=UPI0022FE78C3|nr:uncharacterized protein J7T55_014328 [Diaporthe amygdali]KAJ0117878.1 hypothetical protein J7T55_014328 [Diaporthe amygdali]